MDSNSEYSALREKYFALKKIIYDLDFDKFEMFQPTVRAIKNENDINFVTKIRVNSEQ